MLRYVVANVIAWLLRPIVRAAFLVLGAWFLVTIPARLWVLYVDRHAGTQMVERLTWATAIVLLALWLLPRALAFVARHRRRGHSPAR
jgi:hypothetical protein